MAMARPGLAGRGRVRPGQGGLGLARRGSFMASVLQEWVMALPLMQQTVLIAAVRGPDGIRKDHPTKVLCRWLRRCFLISAFEGVAILDPYDPGGGSFSGPCRTDTVDGLDAAVDLYLRSVDELPHHFQLHFMHAAEILGYKHPVPSTTPP